MDKTKQVLKLPDKSNRKEIGLTWNAVTEVAGVVVVDDVKLILNVQVTQS
jgi:hypothetical protein